MKGPPRRLVSIGSRSNGGFSLIVSLMMLIVIIILGISASQMAVNEERGARNDRDRQLAFQAAEAALKDAEYEILNPASPQCASSPISRGRAGTTTCFDEDNVLGFEPDCSAPPNEGLCLASSSAVPTYLSPNVQFLADAQGTGNNHTVKYGRFTGKTFPTQGTVAGAAFPKYAPRYIIEIVLKNLSTDPGEPHMFRVTAMGFGANPNSQVVLQSVVSTLN